VTVTEPGPGPRVVVPFDATRPKTRLAPVLDTDERDAFARAMLRDVLAAVDTLDDATVDVVSTAPLDRDGGPGSDLAPRSAPESRATVTVDDRSLDAVVDDAIAETVGTGTAQGPLVVVMADLALVTPTALSRLLAPDADVVLAPGRGVGTNALVVRTPGFRTDFHGTSYLDHRRAARDVGTVEAVDSFRLATDVDEPADLVEAFVHGGPATTAWLTERFELAVADEEGRVTLVRQ
jgi:2-phospho-L-lactate guanylyltransferase